MNVDHTVFLTRRYEETWRRYEELGFTLSPPSRHFASRTDGGELVPSCTANRCACFGGSFLELIGIVDEEAGDPWRVLPILHTAEHLTPEYVHQPRYLEHPNGARALARVLLVVPDDEVAAYEDRYAVITGGEPLVDIAGVSDLDAVLPGELPKEPPYFAAHGVAVADLAHARRLVERHVPTTTHDLGFFVSAENACGAAVSFMEAR
ncbi:VOC family protein [Streptomyces sp. MN03-5084-2B]|nr:VOC family protein [Streptomyces sp. MN03-5084-2B]